MSYSLSFKKLAFLGVGGVLFVRLVRLYESLYAPVCTLGLSSVIKGSH